MSQLAFELVCWLNMNTNKDNTVKQCATCLDYQHTQLQDKTMPHKFPSKVWEIFGADIFCINNETLLCIVDYYSKFPSSEEG